MGKKNIRFNDYMRYCKRCGDVYRTYFKSSKICLSCNTMKKKNYDARWLKGKTMTR